VARIRDEEQRTVWTPSLDEQLAAESGTTVHPGMAFTLAKGLMERTKLWRIVRRMPKGALLHAHCDAMVDFDYLFGVLLETDGLHLLCPDGALATPSRRADGAVAFRFLRTAQTAADVWADDYEPGTPVLLTQAADAFPDGGRPGFLAWLKARCTISPTDAIEQHHGVDHIVGNPAGSHCFLGIASRPHPLSLPSQN